MKIKVRKTKREGFITHLAIEFDNGLVLYTQSLLWCGNDCIKQVSKKFGETIIRIRKLK